MPLKFLIEHPIPTLGSLFVLGVTLILWHLNQLSNVQVQTSALRNAQVYTQVLTEFRSLYTSEVIVPAMAGGLEITHDYANRESAIPLPVTLTMLIGKRLGDNRKGVLSQLYSPYPFPWRVSSGGLKDNFALAAWQALQKNPSQPFYQFVKTDGRTSLRYATADLMREQCINCHNTHPSTAKNDWRVGDLRGVLEVTTPIGSDFILADSMIRQTFYLLGSMLMISMTAISFVVQRLRIRSRETIIINKNLQQEISIRQQVENELRQLTYTDPLTGIANRRKFDEYLAFEWDRALRSKRSLSVILVDIDHFKSYNDNYGHQAGDEALRQVAVTINKVAQRSSDLVARYGGEEFVVTLPDTELTGAVAIAEELRSKIESEAIPHQFNSTSNIVTVSVGVACSTPERKHEPQVLVNEADKALYFAKKSGRNCVKKSSGLS